MKIGFAKQNLRLTFPPGRRFAPPQGQALMFVQFVSQSTSHKYACQCYGNGLPKWSAFDFKRVTEMYISQTMKAYVSWLTYLILSACIGGVFGSAAMAVEAGEVFKPHVVFWYNQDYYVTPPQFVEPLDDTLGVLSKEVPDENTIPNIWVLLLDGMETIKSFPRAEEFGLDVDELSRKPSSTVVDIQDHYPFYAGPNPEAAWIRFIVVDIQFFERFLPPECLDDLTYRTIIHEFGTLADFQDCRRNKA